MNRSKRTSKSRRVLLLSLFIAIISCLCATAYATSHGIEASVTLSGSILMGIGYYHQLDDHLILKYGACIGHTGLPVGLNIGLALNFPTKQSWSPYAGLGGDILFARMGNSSKKLRALPFIRSTMGMAYQPHLNLSHHAELWVAYFVKQKRLAPIGINFLHRNAMN